MNRPRIDFVVSAPRPEPAAPAQPCQWPADRGWDNRIRMPESFVDSWAGWDTVDRSANCE